jgi:hypothetical protein
MEKKYVMFVDERGFLTDKDENFTMIGVVFEGDYCSDSKYYECELKMKLDEYKKKIFSECSIVPLDDIILKENVYTSIDKYQRNKFINELPSLFKSLKFSIISSTVKKDTKDSYSTAAKKLLKEFYTYIIKKNGKSGGIILEAKAGDTSYMTQQSFFDIYNERDVNLNILGNIPGKINTFIVCEKNGMTFGTGIEILNILNNIFLKVLNGHKEFDSRLISYIEYGNKNKMFDVIKRKIYRDIGIGIGQDELMREVYNINGVNEELNDLREQLINKDIIIDKKEKEIEKLTNRIEFLKEQLEKVIFNNGRETVMSKILSEINVKIQGLDKITTAAKN